MGIKLEILPHQTECIDRISKVFKDVKLKGNGLNSNPVFEINSPKLAKNINDIQENYNDSKIPYEWRINKDNHFGIDVRMETGTGKTYCYTRLMYELNEKYGFHKFIILVPTTPIKEGTKAFIESEYANKHFSDLYHNRRIELSVLNAQKKKKGKKLFPQAISNFARGTILEKDKISALLMSSGMLLSKATMDEEYDQTLLGKISKPYDVLNATRPIVIIDEPHKFKKENTAYQRLMEKINPLCVIRFGATFPNRVKSEQKDYNNLIYNLGACEAFNNNLVKGVATQMIVQENSNETRIKLMDIINKPKSCIFRNEKTGKNYTINLGESLNIIDSEFVGINIVAIGKTDDDEISKGVTLSNGQILVKGDQIYSNIYGNTYQELMLNQAISNHIEQERTNFFRERKIKTLTLFFIDSIYSYRGEEREVGHLRKKFEELLESKLRDEISKFKSSQFKRDIEYVDYLTYSIKDISNTNGGYFAEDNSTSDEDIQKEVDEILKDKEKLLSFKNDDGSWNIRRFIFSKWTLREGWDNPNVFQICKLRSSGSEINKLQEVGRGLRLPVDEDGNRISNEQFYLTYLYDYSEKQFAESLIQEINKDSTVTNTMNIKYLIAKIAENRSMTEEELFIQLLMKKYIDMDGNIKIEKREDLIMEYPEFNKGLEQNKVIDKNKKDLQVVNIRKEKFEEIKKLWKKINEKYYLSLEEIEDEKLFEAALEILNKDIEKDVMARTIEKKSIFEEDKFTLKEATKATFFLDDTMKYGDFLKRIQSATGLPVRIMHRALCEYNKINKLKESFFNKNTLNNFIKEFQVWFEEAFIKRFSYKALHIDSLETALTDINGNVRDKIIQGTVGISKDETLAVPENFLYDQVIFDSPKEKRNIQDSNIEEVVVFGKIPRRSVQVPLYFGGTTSPDFMYVIRKNGNLELNLVVETKDIDKESSLRGVEKLKIEAAKKFFEGLKDEGINVSFEKQIQNDDIYTMIKNLLSKN